MTIGMAGTGALSAASALNPYTAALGALPALYQLGVGIDQSLKARRLANSTIRPQYQMPAAQQLSLANARNMAYGQPAGYADAMGLLARNQAGGFNAVQMSGAGSPERLATLALMDRTGQATAQSMAMQMDQQRRDAMMNYQSQLGGAADTQNRMWDVNTFQPYKETMEMASRYRDSGPKNIHGGLTGIGGAVASGITSPRAQEGAKATTGLGSFGLKLPSGGTSQAASTGMLGNSVSAIPSFIIDMSNVPSMKPGGFKSGRSPYQGGAPRMGSQWEEDKYSY